MKEITWVDNSDGQTDNILPDVTTYAPRDGMKLGSSDDWMFELWLTRNLIVNRHQYSALLQCDSTHWNCRGREIFLLVHNYGDLHHPIILEKVKPDSIRVMNRLKIDTAIKKICQPLIRYELRIGLYERFFVPVFENLNLFTDSASAVLTIGDLTVYPSQESDSEMLDRLNAGLRWPLTGGADPIIDDWGDRCKKRHFVSPTSDSVREPLPIIKKFFTFSQERLPEHNGICPLDGYITTINAEHKSPGWTWPAHVGRHYQFQLCPHCLRVITVKLITMS